MKGSIRVTWRCPHQKEDPKRTCRKSDCGGSWYYRVRYGQRESKVGGKKKKEEAEKEAVTKLSKWVTGKEEEPKRPKYTVNNLIDAFLAECAARLKEGTMEQSTYDGYETLCRIYIRPLLGNILLDDLSYQRVKEFHRQCKEANPKMASTYLQAINRTLSIAINFGARAKMWLDPVNPCRGHVYPKGTFKAKTWDVPSIQKYWSLAQSDPFFPAYAAMFLQGTRRGETLAMYTEAISPDWVWHVKLQVLVTKHKKKRLTIEPNIKDKLKTDTEGVEEKWLALRPEMIPIVKKLIERREMLKAQAKAEGRFFYEDPEGRSFLMIDENGYPFDPTSVTKHFKTMCKILGLPVVRPHDLRHTFISMFKSAGVDLYLIKDMVGHTEASPVTGDYIHTTAEQQRAAHSKVDLGLTDEGDDPPDNLRFLGAR